VSNARADLPGGLRKTLADDAASSGECAMRFEAVATASAHAGHLQPSFLVQADAMGGAPFSYCMQAIMQANARPGRGVHRRQKASPLPLKIYWVHRTPSTSNARFASCCLLSCRGAPLPSPAELLFLSALPLCNLPPALRPRAIFADKMVRVFRLPREPLRSLS